MGIQVRKRENRAVPLSRDPFYADVIDAGGLDKLLAEHLRPFPAGWHVCGGGSSFEVESPQGRTSVRLVLKSRRFGMSLARAGQRIAGGSTDSIEALLRAHRLFHGSEDGLEQLLLACPWLERCSDSAERSSVELFVRLSWRQLIETWQARGTTFHLLIAACSQQPNLSKLMPFTSMNRLFFSRTKDYPFDQVRVGACTTSDPELFVAYLDLDQSQSVPLPATECAQLLENSLPANLGWAR